MHHIVTDGWSFRVLLRDLGRIYQAFERGEPIPLAELPIQYADYAQWQREHLRGREFDALIDYWKHDLAGAPPLELDTDRPRPKTPTFRGARMRFDLGRERAAALRDLCRAETVTLSVPLMAAFAVVLHRYSGQDDLVIGTLTANRDRLETEDLIGLFVNALPVRIHLGGEPDVAELLDRIRQRLVEVLAHQDVPFDLVVNATAPDRDANRNPLFQVQLVVQPAAGTGELERPRPRCRRNRYADGEARSHAHLLRRRCPHRACGIRDRAVRRGPHRTADGPLPADRRRHGDRSAAASFRTAAVDRIRASVLRHHSVTSHRYPVDPGAVRGDRGSGAGCGGGDRGGQLAHLPAARRRRQQAGSAAAESRGRGRHRRGLVRGPQLRDGGRHARDPQGGRGIRADRSFLSEGPHRLHPRRCRAWCCCWTRTMSKTPMFGSSLQSASKPAPRQTISPTSCTPPVRPASRKGWRSATAASSSTPKPSAVRWVSPRMTSTWRPRRSRSPHRSGRCWCRSPSEPRW